MNKELRRYQILITENLEQEYEFKADDKVKIEGVHPTAVQQTGRLCRKFMLDECRAWCGLNEDDDNKILEVLDGLSNRRQIKFYNFELDRFMHFNNIRFFAEIGLAIIQPRRFVHGFEFVKREFYWKRPFPKTEDTARKPPLQEVKEIRARRDEFFRKQFGQSHELEVEKELYHETLVANTEVANAQITIAKKLDKLVEK